MYRGRYSSVPGQGSINDWVVMYRSMRSNTIWLLYPFFLTDIKQGYVHSRGMQSLKKNEGENMLISTKKSLERIISDVLLYYISFIDTSMSSLSFSPIVLPSKLLFAMHVSPQIIPSLSNEFVPPGVV